MTVIKRIFLPILVILLLMGCAKVTPDNVQQPADNSSDNELKSGLIGIGLSPWSYKQSDLARFFQLAPGDVITWGGGWRRLRDPESIPHDLQDYAGEFGFIPVVYIHLPVQEFTYEEEFVETIIAYVKEYQPRYIGIGKELNYRYDRSEFHHFRSILDRTYTRIKEVSPQTRVFTSFQLEILKGLGNRLFRRRVTSSENRWDWIEQVRADFIAFHTYPTLVYGDPAEIPLDYYHEINLRVARPVAFIEVGWMREGPPGWESSSMEQAEFIQKFYNQTRGMNPIFSTWTALYDRTSGGLRSMGLLETGLSSPAYHAWSHP